MTAPILQARDLTVHLGGRDILRSADLDVTTGERVAVLGLNGAGKTTLFRALLGMTPYRGTLRVHGLEVAGSGVRPRRVMAYVPQRPPRFDGTLDEMLTLLAALRGTPRNAVAARIEAMGLHLRDHGTKLVSNLSGGMIQKALLGLAIACEPDLLLLDEPTANLDPHARRDLLDSLATIPTATTILLASHRLADVEAVARRVVILHRGTFAHDGAVADLGARLRRTAVVRLGIPPADHQRTVRCLAAWDVDPDSISLNGAVEVRIDPARTADLIHRVRNWAIPIHDVAVHPPSLEGELERLLDPVPPHPEPTDAA